MTLEQWLESQGMSQAELARRLSLHESVISRTITGQRPPSAELRWSFANVFGFSVAQQIFNHEQEQPA